MDCKMTTLKNLSRCVNRDLAPLTSTIGMMFNVDNFSQNYGTYRDLRKRLTSFFLAQLLPLTN